ncbi:hypothetical protein EVAR_76838_1 [Eumeta japonica]|uniref:Uncharacterized protein n=1 Tax=Eumeta variegata TaxID=151549 RepID=A0A4C1YZ76_EUMVA|nr:hypothetical protein EVAR_76838_1 [Eumeta japonica]
MALPTLQLYESRVCYPVALLCSANEKATHLSTEPSPLILFLDADARLKVSVGELTVTTKAGFMTGRLSLKLCCQLQPFGRHKLS